jgi:hypothetical protein
MAAIKGNSFGHPLGLYFVMNHRPIYSDDMKVKSCAASKKPAKKKNTHSSESFRT